MKKRVLALLLVVLLISAVMPTASLAAVSLSNFAKVRSYQVGQFTDVNNEWFAPSVQAAYEYGLVNGKAAGSYEPQSNLTIAEAIKLAACINSIYYSGSCSFSDSTPWYKPYVDYALTNKIIKSPYSDYESYATRSDFAVIFSGALPDEACASVNNISDNSIPDVSSSYSYAPAVYKLYRAGILSGSDSSGTFYPNSYITRDACAAIAIRMVSPSFRQSFSLSSNALTAKDISGKCTPSVFYIELYDTSGKAYASGSGFFISSTGLAVTNYHVIDGAASAKITTKDGKSYPVSGVYDYSKTNDLALLQIGGCSGVSYLDLGDSSTVQTGDPIFAIGYPLGVDQTVTEGTVTNASHVIDGVDHIMFSASISSGSSGGALINGSGKVIGVTCATYKDGQNLNLAIPSNLIRGLKTSTLSPLTAASPQTSVLTLTPSSTTVNISQGGQTSVTFVASSLDFTSSVYGFSNTSVASGSWTKWYDTLITCTISGLSAGTTVLTLNLLDANKNVLATANVTVTVTGASSSGSSSVQYYSGYYPVPDWGAFTGTPLYYKYTKNYSTLFYYRVSDYSGGTTVAANYIKLLNSSGFTLNSSNKDKDGYTQLYYNNNTWFLSIGLSNLNGTVCMCVAIVPVR